MRYAKKMEAEGTRRLDEGKITDDKGGEGEKMMEEDGRESEFEGREREEERERRKG